MSRHVWNKEIKILEAIFDFLKLSYCSKQVLTMYITIILLVYSTTLRFKEELTLRIHAYCLCTNQRACSEIPTKVSTFLLDVMLTMLTKLCPTVFFSL